MSPLESDSIESVFKIYNNLPGALAVFDIDNTLVQTIRVHCDNQSHDKLGGDAWFGFFLQASQGLYGKQKGLDLAVALYAVLQEMAQHQVVEHALVDLFAACRDQPKKPMIGLTARGPEVRAITQATLTNLDLQFTSKSGSQGDADPYTFLVDGEEVQFSHVVIFCAGRDKGKVLTAFLNTPKGQSLSQGCQSVFFVDDSERNCRAVLQAMENADLDCKAVHYTYMDKPEHQYTKADAKRDKPFVHGLLKVHGLLEELSESSGESEAVRCSR